MGIETIAAIGIATALATTATTTGIQMTEAHDAKVKGTHTKNDEMRRQGQLQADALDKQKQTEAAQAASALRARNRAYAASTTPSDAAAVQATLGGTGGTAPTSSGLLGI